MTKSVIIVAGGSGLRMGGEVPKQFLPIKGRPMLFWSIERFKLYDPDIRIVLVLPPDKIDKWEELCQKFNFGISLQVAGGGAARFHSVKNGFSLVKDGSLTAVHDGVRPLVSIETIARCYRVAEEKGNAVPCIGLIDSAREVFGEGSRILSRENIRLIQTPQVFSHSQLKAAYDQAFDPSFTDDASVVERAGFPINLVEGNKENIKVTTMLDLRIAELLIGDLLIK